MNKVKRIIALSGVIVLAGLYAATLILAIAGNAKTQNLLTAALVCTFIVPVLLWAYSFIYKLLKDHGPKNNS